MSTTFSPVATLIDGRAIAHGLTDAIRLEVDALREAGIVPALAVILVGDDPASAIYVRSKIRKTEACGMRSIAHVLPAGTTEANLLGLIGRLNADDHIHGILVQLPLPPHIATDAVLDAISPAKDVDGFHVENAGKLAVGRQDGFVPCTPAGCLHLLRTVEPELSGLHAVLIGCSNIVGRPMGRLLLNAGCTVTITHLQTRNVASETRRADIVIAAAGHPGLVRGNWIKPGAIVIDVGINRTDAPAGPRITGDVAFDEVAPHARAITPVPGGVGPMTIAMLLRNTLAAAQNRQKTSARKALP